MNQFKSLESIKEQLQKKGVFKNPEISFIDIGNINYVYKLSENNKDYYMKYYGKTPRKTTPAIDLINYIPERFENEVESLDYLNRLLDLDVAESIPKVHYCDFNDRIMITTDIANDSIMLKEALVNTNNPLELTNIIKKASKLIGQQHARTIKNWTLKEYKDFNKRFYDFRTIHSTTELTKEEQSRVREKAAHIEKANEQFKCITNNDFSPKQIFVKKNNEIGICDFELLSPGIASQDIGFFIGNIKIIEIIKKQPEMSKLIECFLDEYFKTIKEENKNTEEFIRFTKQHLNFFIGLSILNRIDAVPLEKHIPKESIQELRNEAKIYIFNK